MSDSERSRSPDRRSRRQFLRHALLTGVSAATLRELQVAFEQPRQLYELASLVWR
jgi:hypothetical protein